ncbi:hypothetical protein HPB50_025898 [Hyalomma asiaticum]|uniref:Uncharacterized protein n=1 Tax=Hyalomma asiaticum TaxID=266040 RepID=A0ACB7RZG2_HYAAI|nr:hypothetical protein HPB50_025898 [Hyalomma asiaticum]
MADEGATAAEAAPPPPHTESGAHTPQDGGQAPPAGGEQPPPAGDAPAAEHPPPGPDAAEKKPSGESLLAGAQSPSLDAMQMMSKVRQADGIQYSVPVTPDHFLIPGNMTAGTEVYIFGLLSPQAQIFEVKFREAKTLEHVSLLISVGLQPTSSVALRTYQNKTSEDVVKDEVPIAPGSPICVRVKAYADASAKVLYFSLGGDFFTGSVSIFKTQWPDHLHVTIGHQISAGYHFTVEGSVAPDADKMMMNILRCHDVHDDVLLGIVAQFTEPKQLVRRTKQEGVWLEDQVDAEDPFEPGQPFTLEIAVAEEDFHMTVNGKLLPPYKHKVFYGIGHNLCLEKNAKFKSLKVCSISHPKNWSNKLPNVQQATLLLFNSNSPASTSVQLEPGSCFYVQGTPPPPCNEFKVALSKGAEESAEALLMVHVQVQKGLVFVYDGTDANKGAGHQLKVKANRLFSCRVDALADTFKVWVNTLSAEGNVDPFEIKHRFPLNEAAFLNTFGMLNNVTALKAKEDILS